MPNPARLRRFLADMMSLVGGARQDQDEAAILDVGGRLLADLVGHDDWLPEASAASGATGYQQHLLYCDPQERFSVVSFVWAPGALTPVHDHMVWGLIGMLRGAEIDQRYELDPAAGQLVPTRRDRLMPGDIGLVSPTLGDIHQVGNGRDDQPSISIHVYGGNIGAVRRHRYDLAHGTALEFVSGYSPTPLPNIWDHARGAGA